VLLDIAAPAGLVELLTSRAALEDVIHRDQASGLDVIPVIASNPFSTELLGTQKLASLIALTAEQYDLIIIDTPPIAASADALLLSRLIDAAVLVVQWGRAPRRLVGETVRSLLAANMPLAGLVLTQVDVKAYAGYGNGRHPTAYARRYYAA
jgi:Mrp family chromosome partitioning ATPase